MSSYRLNETSPIIFSKMFTREQSLNTKDAAISTDDRLETRDILFPHQQAQVTTIACDIVSLN